MGTCMMDARVRTIGAGDRIIIIAHRASRTIDTLENRYSNLQRCSIRFSYFHQGPDKLTFAQID